MLARPWVASSSASRSDPLELKAYRGRESRPGIHHPHLGRIVAGGRTRDVDTPAQVAAAGAKVKC